MMVLTDRPENFLYVALDYPSIDTPDAQDMIDLIQEYGINAKIGTEISVDDGWTYPIKVLKDNEIDVFVDTKFNDIDNTITKSVRRIFSLSPAMVNMHASAGIDAMTAFINERNNKAQTELIKTNVGTIALAVTVLTSKTSSEIKKEYNGRTLNQQVEYYAIEAANCGFDGVICGANELKTLNRNKLTKHLLKVALGCRPIWAPSNDQRRPATPAFAVANGTSKIVIGRPITSPPKSIGKPRFAIESILEEIALAIKKPDKYYSYA